MEELLNLLKDKYIIYDYSELVIIYNMLCTVKNKLEPIDISNIDKKEVLASLESINYYDIGKALLLCYYIMKPEEYEERLKLLLDFITINTISDRTKIFYIKTIYDEIHSDKKEDFSKEKSLIERKIKEVRKRNFRIIIENLHFLAEHKRFLDTYGCISYVFCIESRKPSLNEHLSTYYELNASLMKGIKNRIEFYHKEIRKVSKKNDKSIAMFENTKEKIENIFNKNIIDINDIRVLKDIINDDIIFNKVLQCVLKHNNKHIKEKLENKDFDKEKIEELFINYEYDKFDKELKIFIEKNYSAVNSIMTSLLKSKIIIEENNLLLVLENAVLENIECIKTFFYKEFIDNNFINKNIMLIIDKNMCIDFMNKITFLISNQLNVKKIIDYIDIININIDDLINNINMLKYYKININKKELYDYNFLIESDILDIIDIFIEENLDTIIKKNPEYLDYNIGKRIHINHLISNSVRNRNKNKLLSTVLSENNYFLKDEDLDLFLCSHTEEYLDDNLKNILQNTKRNTIDSTLLEDEIVITLDNKFLDGENYIFDSTIISRIKFLRNYNIVKENNNYNIRDIIYNCLIFNSYLLHDELLFIKESINFLFKDKKYTKNIR